MTMAHHTRSVGPFHREVTARTWKPIMNGEHKNCLDKVCEKCFEQRINETHIAGKAAAHEAVYSDLLAQAAQLFKIRRDVEADLVRNLAEDQQKIAIALRIKQKNIREGKED